MISKEMKEDRERAKDWDLIYKKEKLDIRFDKALNRLWLIWTKFRFGCSILCSLTKEDAKELIKALQRFTGDEKNG